MGYQSATPSPIVRSRFTTQHVRTTEARGSTTILIPRTRTRRLQDRSRTYLFCGIHICEYLDVVFVSDLLARVDVYENSHWSFVSFASAAPKPKLSGEVR